MALSVKASLLDDGVVDTLVSVGATSGVHPSVYINASGRARSPRAATRRGQPELSLRKARRRKFRREPVDHADLCIKMPRHEAAARLLEVDPAFTISSCGARGGHSNATLLTEGLRKAGLPE